MQIYVEGQGQTQRQRLAEYRYDHRGLRNRKTTAQEDTHYLYDDSRQLQGEVNAQGRLQRQYVYLADQPLVGDSQINGQPSALKPGDDVFQIQLV